MGGEARFVQTDVADESAVRDLVDAAVDTFGGIDIIVTTRVSTSSPAASI